MMEWPSSGFCLSGVNPVLDFLAVDCHVRVGLPADSHFVAANIDDGGLDPLAARDDDCFFVLMSA